MSTGSMPAGRYYHSATLLGNGKVLVAGGYGSSGVLSTAALYDSTDAGNWSATGSMPAARAYHTATLLDNGKVLVVGGYNGSALASTTLYDPATGTWTASGSLNNARFNHTAVLLWNGKVLVAGGYNSNVLSSAELYDPTTGTWTVTGSMSVGRYIHTATALSNGKVLAAGGLGTGSVALASATLYDPAAGTWSSTASMPSTRYNHTATLLYNGKVLLAAGYGSTFLSSAVLYDPAAGSWTTTGSLGTARNLHKAALLPDGKVFVVGGYASFGYVGSGEIYNPASGAWTTAGSMKTERYAHGVVTLPDGRVLIAGGYGWSGILSSAELFVPTVSSWTATGSMNIEHEFHTATLLQNGKVLVAAGWINTTVTDIAELYNPRTGTWTTTGSLPSPRYLHTATLLANGKVLVVGGYSTSLLLSNTALYDPAAGTWSGSGSLPHGRYYHTATLLSNGKVLVAGGTTNGSTPLANALLYDPAAGTWTATASMGTARLLHTATLLGNGKVLVAGGTGATAELYDPGIGTWTATGSMPAARAYHTATVLTNGKVLVAAGYGVGGILASAALYDPALGTWATTGSMSTGRYYHQMVSLPDGKIMVVGGLSGGNTASCELYDPASGTWSPTGSLRKGRYDHTATALANGKVLVAGGGRASYEPMPDAELYAPLLIDPKNFGKFAFSTAIYASTGVQAIARYQSPTSGYSISRRLDIDDFWPFVDSGSWGFDSTSVPINGILKIPSGTGPFPLALFVHGNHDPFDFSDEGYIYLCEQLASWGVLAATIDANYMNYFGCCGENDGRAILHLEHVRQFIMWHTTSGHGLFGKVDTNNIMIVGHSRGGEGVGHASYFNTLTSVVPDFGGPTVPLDGSVGLGPYGLKLKAVVAIAPTDGQYEPVTGPTKVRDNYLVFHGSRDGDVWTFDGYLTYDRAHPVTLAATGFKALAWSVGANHNYFNTTWIDEPDGSPTLTSDQQTNVARVYIGGMAQATILGRPRYLDLLKDYEVGKSWLPSGAEFQSQYQDTNRLFINHYEEDDIETTLSPPSSGANSWSADEFGELYFNLGWWTHLFEDTDGVRLSWISPSDYYQISLSGSGINSGAYQYLVLRIGQSTEFHNPGGDQDLRIIIQDTAGGSASYHAAAFPRLLYPDTGAFVSKIVMQSIRIPLSLVRDRVNLKNIAVLKLAFDRVSSGTVYFDEVQLSN